MKSTTQRRMFSLLLALVMLFSLLPALGSTASAAGSGTTESDPKIVTTYAELSSALSSGTAYVKLGANINTKGLNDGANAGDDKGKAAYYAGIQIGQQISNQMIKGINEEVFGEDSTKSISLKNFMAGFVAGTTGKNQLMTMDIAQQVAQQKTQAIKRQSMEKQFGANKAAGEKFLAENKKKPGVKVLPSGVQYKVIKVGNGPMPKDTSMVSVNYEGRTIDGKVFDSSYKRNQPLKLRANQVIKGWTEALVHMPVGSVWEVYIPQDLAYGDRQQGNDIKPFSTLVFKIELLGIE